MADGDFIKGKAVDDFRDSLTYAKQILCKIIPPNEMNNAIAYLLTAILLKLTDLTAAQTVGTHYFRLTPYALGTTAVKILDVDFTHKTRKVVLWFDAVKAGNPYPTLRVGPDVNNANTGGVQVAPGTFADFGLVPSDKKLYAASSIPFNMYVIEHG